MTEEEFIESRIQYWKDLRNRFIKHYQELDGVVDEETLSKVGDIITTAEQRQLRALGEIPKVWAEVTGKQVGDEYHTKESWAEWQQRNIVDPKLIDKIRRVAFKEAPVTDLQDHIGAMFTLDWYSPEVATAYVKATKQAEQAYQEMLDKAHEEALDEDLRRDLKLRADKEREEALCEAADKTLQEYADIAAGRDLESTAKRLKEAREKHGTPYWTVEAPRRTGRTFRNWLCNYFK